VKPRDKEDKRKERSVQGNYLHLRWEKIEGGEEYWGGSSFNPVCFVSYKRRAGESQRGSRGSPETREKRFGELKNTTKGTSRLKRKAGVRKSGNRTLSTGRPTTLARRGGDGRKSA